MINIVFFLKEKIRRRELETSQERRDLGAVAVVREAVRGAIKVCDTINKYTEKLNEIENAFQINVGIPLPKPIKDAVSTLCIGLCIVLSHYIIVNQHFMITNSKKCDKLNPCKYFCPEQTNLGGCTTVR